MSTIPSSLIRTSTAMGADLLLSNLRRSNTALLRIQTELSTGLRVNRPSDAPGDYSAISTLRNLLARYDQNIQSLDNASNIIDVTDSALGDVSDLLLQAQSIASSQIGATSDATTRRSEAAVIDSLIDTLRDLANREYGGVYLFGGRTSNSVPFTDHLGGIRYGGAADDLQAFIGGTSPFALNTNGATALGALSTRVAGSVDLDPDATADTRIRDISGARNTGFTPGTVTVTVNGVPADVDLTGAATLGDVATLINNALGAAGSLSVTADGFTLTAGAADTVSIADIGTGVTAADLGIALSATLGGATAGVDVNPKLTPLTSVSQLGAAVNLAGGLKITNGSTTKVIDFTGAATVQDLVNRVAAADLGVRLEINADATGFNLVNEVSGTKLTIGENAGGTTAGDLGLRSFAANTLLSDFNSGLGVGIVAGSDDLRIELADGVTVIDVNLDGATDVQGVLDAINTAGGGAVTASLAADGNGIVLTDTIGGAGTFRVTALNNSSAAADLGILKASATSTISGDDVAPIETESVFTHLIALRNALLNDDTRGITLAGEKITGDTDRIAVVRAQAGVRSNRLALHKGIAQEQKIQTQSLLSGLQDTDFAEAISRFQQLQQQLQASMISGQALLQSSLLDFLR